ncbi:ExeM/NucH family extracellular endonuclease [Nocardioides sp. HDW12B]|uniref:ExeM/NucH family extracellular endonuclease n=1 Tax=Nocardioides sp. HDW12B TaxID=2714939 RepID=UPI0014073C19|nr:ExeM/NucH family extracellular endonuclease [Nocardioides sp. HDW12B]QIK66168.1 ExeM/NucH family extracellular endonuclease [Nocardioides sp. HDW12B]
MRSRTRTTPLVLALGTTAAVVTGLISPVPASAAAPTAPYISEIHYDNTGNDVDEFVEVTLPPGTSSEGLSLVLYNGTSSANAAPSYDTDAVTARTAPADESLAVAVGYPANGLQNGERDAIALVRGGQVLEFLSYEGVTTAGGGPAAGSTSTDIGVREAGTEPVGQSLQRTYDAASDRLVWSGPAPASKGQVNAGGTEPEPEPEPEVCDLTPTHRIGQVQGDGAASPLVGQQVVVRGTVVGDLPGFSGFYLQDAGDGDDATSDGLFVFSPAEVDLGDEVAVAGAVAEFGGQTQVGSREDVEVCADGTTADLPAPAGLDLPASDAEREPFEGMRVEPVDTLTVSEVFDLTSFGELTLSEGGLLVQPTELARPGPEAEAIRDQNTLRRIVLDDGRSARVSTTTRPYLSPRTPVRVGDELSFTEPLVLGYGFSQWRLQPADGTADGVFAPQNTRQATPDPVGGDVQVGAFNVLNYFLTLSGPDARGARTAAQLEKQAGKIVPAVNALGADVVTLMEIEDTDSTGYAPGNADAALADLVRRLNADAGAGTWDYVPMPEELYGVDRDAIRNAIIFKPAAVRPVGDPVGLVDEDVWFNAREPIAQTFTGRAPAEDDVFTVVANHFKSKSAGESTGDNADAGDGQGQWNGDRTRQAASLAAFTDSLRAETEDDDVLLLGDFNAYTQEDPIERLRDAGFDDLGDLLDAGRYSYVFDEQSGSLDHALSTASLTEKVTDLAHWNVNAVESFAYQYTGDPALYAPDAFRSSDHDPLVLGLDLEVPTPAAYPCDGRVPTLIGTQDDDVLRGTARPDVVHALSGDDTVTGLNADDVVCGGAGDDVLEGGNGADRLLGGSGDDVLRGGNGTDVLDGGSGENTLVQGRG